MPLFRSCLTTLLCLIPGTALASETVTYTYDARGRLTSVSHAGGAVDGVASSYVYDAADNRTTRVVTGAPSNNSLQGVIVVPLNGMTVIPLPKP